MSVIVVAQIWIASTERRFCFHVECSTSYNISGMSKYTAFRCPDDLLAKAKVRAARDRRSLSNYLITLIEKDVKDEPTPKMARPAPSKKKR